MYVEDDDVAAVSNGCLTIHRIRRNHDDPNESTSREIFTLKLEIQQIMKGAQARAQAVVMVLTCALI